MTENEWLCQALTKESAASKDYRQRAFLLALSDLLEEQASRIEKRQGQLDGSLWSPTEWDE